MKMVTPSSNPPATYPTINMTLVDELGVEDEYDIVMLPGIRLLFTITKISCCGWLVPGILPRVTWKTICIEAPLMQKYPFGVFLRDPGPSSISIPIPQSSHGLSRALSVRVMVQSRVEDVLEARVQQLVFLGIARMELVPQDNGLAVLVQLRTYPLLQRQQF